jgi:hypothetical protein
MSELPRCTQFEQCLGVFIQFDVLLVNDSRGPGIVPQIYKRVQNTFYYVGWGRDGIFGLGGLLRNMLPCGLQAVRGYAHCRCGEKDAYRSSFLYKVDLINLHIETIAVSESWTGPQRPWIKAADFAFHMPVDMCFGRIPCCL